MRKNYLFAGLVTLGLVGLATWVTWGSAQPTPIIEPINPMSDDPAPVREPGYGKPGKVGSGVTEPIPVKPAPKLKPMDTESADPPIVIDPFEIPANPKIAPAPGKLPIEPVKAPETPIKVETYVEQPLARPVDLPAAAAQPCVSLEWVGPAAVKLGVPTDYQLVVRNTGTIAVQKVIVQVRVPSGVNVVSAEPKAEVDAGILVWELGTFAARHENRIRLKLSSPQRGDVACQAWVTFTGSAALHMKVRDPQLAVKVKPPERALIGDPANLVLTVSNPGDHPAEHVRITANIPEGLECLRGSKFTFEMGALAAGESRNVTVPCLARNPGKHQCDFGAVADGGLQAADSAAVTVVQPRLDVAIAGPKLRYLDRRGTFAVKVTNPGDLPATNVFLTEIVPPGFKFVAADAGGQFDGAAGSVKWFIGEIGPGESKEVKVDLLAITAGEFTHKATASASRGMKADHELRTTVEGLSAIMMEVVDIEDPVEVGGDTAYEIRVTNTGSKAETNVKLICTLPAQMKLKSVKGPAKYEVVGKDVVFQPLERLAPRADVVYMVTVTAVQKGDARFKAALTTASLVEPVVKVEPTKVYGD
jgi:uncharacterized repeat protein (TIGR01451 family)